MKNILITGASGGMGFATCKLLAENGYRCFGIDYKMPREETSWETFLCDLTDMESVENAKEKVQLSLEGEKLDAIIHFAGKYDLNSLVEMPEKDFTGIFNINVFAIFRVNKTFLSLLNPNSRIIITASELAPLDPLPFTGIYGITKTAIEKYCHSLRMELQLLGHKVIELRPGAVETDLLDISQNRINNFAENTRLYKFSGNNFKTITEKVESRKIPVTKIAKLVQKILTVNNPKFIYNINRNPLLLLLNALPDRFQTWIIKIILLKDKNGKKE